MINKYQESKVLDEALYFLNEKGIDLNKIKVPAEIKKEAETAIKIVVDKLKKLESTKEYKDHMKQLEELSVITSKEKGIKLYEDIEKEVVFLYKKYCYSVFITTNRMSQDVFYHDDNNDVHIYDFTDKLFKELKQDKKLISLPHFYNITNGDDYWGYTLYFKLCSESEIYNYI